MSIFAVENEDFDITNWLCLPLIHGACNLLQYFHSLSLFFQRRDGKYFYLPNHNKKFQFHESEKGVPGKQITLSNMLPRSVKYGLYIKADTFGQKRLLKHRVLCLHVLNLRLKPQKA
jgi:hypothetical protein